MHITIILFVCYYICKWGISYMIYYNTLISIHRSYLNLSVTCQMVCKLQYELEAKKESVVRLNMIEALPVGLMFPCSLKIIFNFPLLPKSNVSCFFPMFIKIYALKLMFPCSLKVKGIVLLFPKSKCQCFMVPQTLGEALVIVC